MDERGSYADVDLYRAVFSAFPVPVLLLDANLMIMDATATYLQAVDRARADLLGRHVLDVFPDQPGGVDGPLASSMRLALTTGQPDRLPLFDYDVRANNGTPGGEGLHWSVVNVPILGPDGQAVALLNAVEDVTQLVIEQRRSQLAQATADGLAAQTLALTEDLEHRVLDLTRLRTAELRSSRRLAALGEVALELANAETVDQLTEIVVVRGVTALGADGGAIAVLDATGTQVRLHITDSLGAEAQRIYGDLPLHAALPATVATRTGKPVLLGDQTVGRAFSAEMAKVYDTVGKEAWAALPLRLGGDTLGSITISWDTPQEFTAGDVALLNAFAAQCAHTLERLSRREAERASATVTRQMSEALQRSLLTTPAQPDHLQIIARYLPAARGVQVGGDWYDAFQVADGGTLLVVGDVSGHDRDAAAAMAQVRNILRGIAHRMIEPPAAVLTALDEAMRDLEVGSLVTAILAKVEQTDHETAGALRTLRWSNAGHPPPLLVSREGATEELVRPADLLLGVDAGRPRHDHEQALHPGSTVLLYTDGLVERRGATLDEGIERLKTTVASLTADGRTLDELCDALLAELGGSFDDDVALLAVRAHPEDRRPPEAGPSVTPADAPSL